MHTLLLIWSVPDRKYKFYTPQTKLLESYWIYLDHMTPCKIFVLGFKIRIGLAILFETRSEESKMADDELVAMNLS